LANQEELLTAIGDALTSACARLEKAEIKSKLIVLLSDGESNTGLIKPDEAIKGAKALGIKVYTIGVGSNGRAPFMAQDGFGRKVIRYAEVRIDEDGDLTTTGNITIDSDSSGLILGDGQDGSVIHTGTGLELKSNLITATDHLLLQGGTNGIDFNIGATEKMTLLADGLLVHDKIQFTQTDGNEFINSLNDGYMDYGATTAHRFNTDKFVILATGNVGIGTASPKAVLSVGSDLAIGQILTISDSSTYKRGLGKDMSGGGFELDIFAPVEGTNGVISLGFVATDGTTYTEKMVIKSGGNVGIGTTSPQTRLDVRPTARVTAYNAGDLTTWSDIHTHNLINTENAASGISFSVYGLYNANAGAGMAAIRMDTTAELDLAFITRGDAVASSEKMRITSTGNVGIGVTDPHSKLEVNGAISSSTATVTTSADNTDVSGINTLWITTAGGDVVLGGLTGGVDGQVLYVIRKDTTNDLTLENAEGAGDQDFIMHQGSDEIIDGGGVVLVCDGSDWYDCSHAKHV